MVADQFDHSGLGAFSGVVAQLDDGLTDVVAVPLRGVELDPDSTFCADAVVDRDDGSADGSPRSAHHAVASEP